MQARQTKFWAAVWLLVAGTHLSAATPPKKWQASVPAIAAKPEDWKKLTDRLVDKKMHYGAMAAANRILLLFPDVEIKELAYRTLISLIDTGYPHPMHSLFANADIEPSDSSDFVNSYYLYKGIANGGAGTPRWAKYYFEKVDKDNFPKFQFFTALQSYSRKDLDGAETLLRKLLTAPKDMPISLLSKVARTLARIYFEREQYDKSLDVYRSFLLRLNPMTPSDWLESAWNLYHLKRYEEALGHLYNLEAKSAGEYSTLERFVLRALIYRGMCAKEQIKALADSFQAKYRVVLEGIKGGEPLRSFPVLRTMAIGNTARYVRMYNQKELLSQEVTRVGSLGDARDLAKHLYDTEITNLMSDIQLFEESALQSAGSYLINLHESIKFLGFDVAREIYNPDRVFSREVARENHPLMQEDGAERFQLHWEQVGSLWRDERQAFRAMLKNSCLEDQKQ